MKLTKKLEDEVLKAYHAYWDSYLKGDMKTFASILDKDCHIIGSTAFDIFDNKKDAVEFYSATANQIAGVGEMRNRKIVVLPYVEDVLVQELHDYFYLNEAQWHFYGQGRISTLFSKRKGSWKIIHQHGSLPDSKATKGEQLGTEIISQENRQLRDAIKRRTIELEIKNRELEIESSLERVRTVAMSMNHREDMLLVCRMISRQLELLNVKEIRNVQTAIFYPEKGTYMNYEFYAKHDKTFITETVYTDHELANAFAMKMQKGRGEVSVTLIHGEKKVKEWLAYQKNTNVFIDSFLETANSLNYYWFSLGTVALGISAYVLLTDDELTLFKRFLNVFELSYRRYLDIENAAVQAKEARVETALERVRVVAMAMRRPDDLLGICETQFKELRELGFEDIRNTLIGIYHDEENYFTDYDYSDFSGGTVHKIPYNKNPLVDKALTRMKSATDEFTEFVVEGEELEEWKAFRKENGEYDDARIHSAQMLYYYFYSIKEGNIGISTFKKISDDQLLILKRFRNVFDLAYRRYIDISNAEIQAKEARIETALERVRAVAMSMMKSDELLNICESVFTQLRALGFEELRNAQIYIKYDDQQKFENYNYSDYSGSEKIEVMYNSHSNVKKFREIIETAIDAFAENHISGKELESWKSYLVTKLGQKHDVKLEAATELHYYFYSVGTGALGISSFKPIPREDLDILKRFRNVFSLSYQRYLDISNAEAQAKEAKIEAGLERVRSSAMAMHSSKELGSVVKIVFENLRALGMEKMDAVNINILHGGSKEFDLWIAAPGQDYTQNFRLPYLNHPIADDFFETVQRGESIHKKTYGREVKNRYFEYMFIHSDNKYLPEERKQLILNSPGYAVSAAIAQHSCIFIHNYQGELFSNEDDEILVRFAKVFDQAYHRFLDLQKAEAQAREATIEAALEKVRSRSLAMHESNEIKEVVTTVVQKINELNIEMNGGVSLVTFTPGSKDFVHWILIPEHFSEPFTAYLPWFEHVMFHDCINAREQGMELFAKVYSGEEKDSYFKHLFEETDFKNGPEGVKEWVYEQPYFGFSFAIQKNSGIFLNDYTGKLFSTETNNILIRFAKVFEQAYVRFLDLQKAEAQARESQIQLALERVRARTMAMQQSDELLDAITVMADQLRELNLKFDNVSFGINAEDDYFKFWVSAAGQPRPVFMQVPYINNPAPNRVKESQKKGIKFFADILTHEENKQWTQHLIDHSELKAYPEKIKKYILDSVGYARSTVILKDINLYVGNYRAIPYSEEDNEIFKRFARVFEQAYTRFLDLQKAEAQAREATIEAALERVRSRTMGMQKSEELKEIIKVVYEQFVHLNIHIEHAGFIMDYKTRDDMHIWLADKHLVPSEITIPYFDSPHWNSYVEAKEKGMDFFANNLDFEAKNKFYKDLFELIPGLPEETKEYYFSCPGVAISTVLLDNVGLYIENFAGIPYSEEENSTLMRMGKVFQQTYTRFLDLQKAEAQTREAMIEASLERVRSKAMAMHTSNDLAEAAGTVFTELNKLGIKPIRSGFVLLKKDSRKAKLYPATSFDNQNTISFTGEFEFTGHPIYESQYESWKKKENYFPVLEGDLLRTYYEMLAKGLSVSYENFPTQNKKQFGSFLPFTEGFLFTWSEEPYAETELSILERFKSILDLTIRRYLDLQNAEAQARESQIEAALERVRSRTMAMQRSENLFEVIREVNDQLHQLGFRFDSADFMSDYSERGYKIWLASAQEVFATPMYIAASDTKIPGLLKGVMERGDDFFTFTLDREEKNRYFDHVFATSEAKNATEESKQYVRDAEGMAVSCVVVKNIILSITNFACIPYTDAENDIIKRFGFVFEQSYTRFLDLKKAEAQAREAQIEAALERVRSRTLAMQKSHELSETAAVLFKQLINLGIEPNRLYIGIIKENSGEIEWWATDEDGSKVNTQFTGNKDSNPTINKMYTGWKEEKKFLTIEMQGKELEDYLHYLSNDLKVSFKSGTSQKRRVQSIAYFGKGFIGIASPDAQPADTINLLERFAAVFNLTYTRFNDLKISEVHAVQAEEDLLKLQTEKKRAEEALTELKSTQAQLIQSEKMASLGELTAGIAHEIQNPLNFVNNFSELSVELLKEMVDEVEKGNAGEARAIADDLVQNLEKINHHGKRADAIVKGMLQHSRNSGAVKEPTDINALAEEYLRLAYHGLRAKDKTFNATMKTDLDEHVGNIHVIPQDIGRVILNLITNAFYAVNEKARSVVSTPTAATFEPTVSVTTKKINNKIEIKIIDNGNGIPASIKDKIFHPFFTTKPTGQGTGLGLSLSYDIVKAHGGELKVETKNGEGSVFIIQLPIV